MKAKYKFQIEGEVKLDPNQMLPIKDGAFNYEFLLDSRNVATHIEVTVPVSEEWYPKMLTIKDNYHQLVMDNPALRFALRNLKGIESLMSIWGLKSIDRRTYEIKWFPESQLEKDKLKINNFSVKSEKMSIEEIPPLSYDLAARSIISSWDGANISVVTGFYRKGCSDIENGEYIDAIYDFYLILETCYCEGKWRGNEVKKRLKASNPVMDAFNSTIQNALLTQRQKESVRLRVEFHSFEGFIDHIVDVRGQLHHHSEKNLKAWDPNRPEDFDLEAIYLHSICYHLIFNKIWEYIDKPEVKDSYNSQCRDYINERT